MSISGNVYLIMVLVLVQSFGNSAVERQTVPPIVMIALVNGSNVIQEVSA
jgi:hypothetical protein